MKAAVVFLVFLGLLAAVSAAVLIQTLMHGSRPAPVVRVEDEIEIPVAAADLKALTSLRAENITMKKVRRSEVTEGVITSSINVLGRVLTTRMLEGEPFRQQNFAREGSGLHMVSTLPKGMRAMSLSLSDWSGMAGLLYPGCVVDILVTLRSDTGGNNTRANNGSATVVSTTLLQGVQVLAIGAQSVTSDEYKDKAPGALAARGEMDHRMVTVMVDPKQAEILQLAVQNGTISLAMRNPEDVGRESKRITRTSELVNEKPLVASSVTAALASLMRPTPAAPEASDDPTDVFRRSRTPRMTRAAAPDLWEMLIIRGGVTEKKTFPMPEPESRESKSADTEHRVEAGF